MITRAVVFAFAAALLCAQAAHAQRGAPARQDSAALAAKHFAAGQTLYGEGRFTEAIKELAAAHKLSPHPSTLFNIARCHENLANWVNALEFYGEALAATSDPAVRTDIALRIERLRRRPVKVFVSSLPSGAEVLIGGQRASPPRLTPALLELAPGPHVLVVELEGYLPAVRHLQVEVEKEQPIEIKLEPRPQPCPKAAPAPRCPPLRRCPQLRLVDPDELHIHASIFGAFGLTSNRPMAAGPGIHIVATFRRVIFGASFSYFPMGEEQYGPDLKVKDEYTTEYTKQYFRWLLVQVEGGYILPFQNFMLYATLGAGLSTDRVIFEGTRTYPDSKIPAEEREVVDRLLKEEISFAWSAGGGIQVMATRWLAVGSALRFGLIHGRRADKDNADLLDRRTTFPFGVLWGSVTFHL